MKIKTFCASKDTVQLTEWEEIFANLIRIKVLTTFIEFLQLNKNDKQLNFYMTKGWNRNVSKQDTQMFHKHRKECLSNLIKYWMDMHKYWWLNILITILIVILIFSQFLDNMISKLRKYIHLLFILLCFIIGSLLFRCHLLKIPFLYVMWGTRLLSCQVTKMSLPSLTIKADQKSNVSISPSATY